MKALDRFLDLFRGRTVTIPPLDGAFKPNRALDEALVLAALPEPDDLAVTPDGTVLVAAGHEVSVLEETAGKPLTRFDSPVTALAALPQGGFVAGLGDGALRCVGGPLDGWSLPPSEKDGLRCPTAIVAASPDMLFVAQGSHRHAPSDWAVDLMEGGATGAVWRVDLRNRTATRLIDDLAWASGLLVRPDGDLIVSEAWRHRLLRVPAREGAKPDVLLDHLPGYPGRLSSSADGGAWACLFAPRNRLVEFVLTEADYRADMMAGVDRRFWISPALRSGASFLEPLQSGGVVTMGVKKPWAPSRSYGLVAKLGAGDLRPVATHHSRADGTRHGITAAVERDDRLLVASKGGDLVLGLDLTGGMA